MSSGDDAIGAASGRRGVLVAACALALGCAAGTRAPAPTAAVSPDLAAAYEPARDLGPLFHDVQLARLFADSKTFADARALLPPSELVRRYADARDSAGFSLSRFAEMYFEPPRDVATDARADRGSRSMEEHIRALWPVLTREADHPDTLSSLIPLPHPYVVPGGRFREVYYWDSYFTMLGLVESGRLDLVRSMLDNFAHLVRTLGHIPNGNRTYYLGRSQPPYFAAMVGLYARAADTARALSYLPALEAEYAFWMDGGSRLAPGDAHRRVVKLSSGALLNRYWDDIARPRPESYREDEALGRTLPPAERERFYRNVRAAAESGWDFSSRWMRDPKDLRTLETIDIAPVDLNGLLYHAERTIAAFRRFRRAAGDARVAARFDSAADARRRALLAAAWDSTTAFFYDVRWRTGERVADRPTMAATSVLYFDLATPQQGRAVADRLEREFLRAGGFVTTLIASGQQWDAPNGWPPLQWLAIEGARRYGRADLADNARSRWLALNRRTYRATGKMVEKYDVVDPTRRSGGGEYPAQDGFGWTNGVALALSAELARPALLRPSAPAGLPLPRNARIETLGGSTYRSLHTNREEWTMPFRFTGIDESVAEDVRRTMSAPGYGHPAHRETARGYGPCRVCLRTFEVGAEERILFTYQPFTEPGSLPSPGPVFVHGEACERYDSLEPPPDFARLPLVVDGFGPGSAPFLRESVGNQPIADVLERVFAAGAAYAHIRNGEAGCFMARVEQVADGD